MDRYKHKYVTGICALLVVVVPALFVAIRIWLGLVGWMFFIYLMFGIIVWMIAQTITTLAIGRWARSASESRLPFKLAMAATAVHLLMAVTFSDFGDAPDSAAYSPLSQLIGEGPAYLMSLCLILVWAILQIASQIVAGREALRNPLWIEVNQRMPRN